MVAELLVNVAASAVFLLLMLVVFRPRIRISPLVARQRLEEDGEMHYVFQLVNRSWFDARNVRIVVRLVWSDAAGGRHWVSQVLGRDEIELVKGRRPGFLNFHHENVASFSRPLDLQKYVGDNRFHLECLVTATHPVSGLMGSRRQLYFPPPERYILDGQHPFDGAELA